ncbi:peptidase S8 and S53 subtilisin kexin sedolisin, partial [mine drainage metagenome]
DQNVYSLSGDCAGRQTGDVAAVADPSTGVAVYDTYSQSGWLVFGGTSVSTQIIGATYGLAAGSGTLQAAPGALYTDDASGGTGPTAGLVPVTSGSNTSCGDYLCDASDSLSSGYNGPTGLGTPYGVGAFMTSTSTSPGFGLSATPASATVTQGSATSYAVSVSPSGGFDGNVTLSV